jgi:hypothetical protein
MINNKRGDKILSAYWFAVLLIVAGGVFAMVYLFYGVPYDVRDIESHLLINAVADCISYGGRIDSEFISSGNVIANSSFFDKCHLNFNSPGWNEEQYYTEVYVYSFNDVNNSILNIKKGNDKWVPQCAIQEDKESEKLAKCSTKMFYSLDNENNQYLIKILGVVRKSEQNVKT